MRERVKERVQVLPDLETISWRAADLFVSLSRRSISSKRRFAVALSGGSTPKRLYALLGSDLYRDRTDWQSIHLFWADERCVPKEHEASNYKMAFEALLSKVPVPAPNIHRIKGEGGPEKGAKDYEEELRDFFGRTGLPVFDLVILGIGEDGHIASLFPGSPSLFETERLAVPVPVEKPRADRITLTLPVLNNALQILFLVAGLSKADVLSEIFSENKREQYPAGRIHPVHGNLQWFIDQEASGRLERIKSKWEGQTVLAGDVGGTETRLGLFGIQKGRPHLLQEEEFSSQNYEGLEDILKDFLKGKEEIAAACLGVAGPVTAGHVKTTNLPWQISTSSLKKELSLVRVEIINDLVANAYGISVLKRSDFGILNPGRARKGNVAILSAGTGLGVAILFWDGKRHLPSPSEGGHVEFGPRNLLEMDLYKYLFSRFGHVSYERILSGPGLFHLYQFVKDSRAFRKEPEWLSKMMKEKDPASVISEMARLKKNRLCAKALDLFASIYGAAAGNLALQVMAVGGIYIGGGIAPKIIWKLKEGSFMEAFKNKGQLSHVVAHIPVKVIRNEKTALLGAAARAIDLLKD